MPGRLSELPYGEWIRPLCGDVFVVDDLIEPRPAATLTYSYEEERRWPSESIWKPRKAG